MKQLYFNIQKHFQGPNYDRMHGINFRDFSSYVVSWNGLWIYNSNSLSLCLFRANRSAGEEVLHLDKFHEHEFRNYFPSTGF